MRFALILWILIALPSTAGELCFTNISSHNPCPPDDIAYLVDRVGFSTDSTPCAGAGHDAYLVTLSASATDPFVNSGSIPDGKLYVWNAPLALAAAPAAYGWGFLFLQITGDLPITDYEPIAAGANTWDGVSGWLDFSTCEAATPTLIGAFQIGIPTAIDTPVASDWGGVKGLYR